MTFSARDAILNDDEEWFNIPAVVRNFLRQLNNELQSNRLTCDRLLQNHQEHDTLLRGIISKQMEREFEMTKTVLTLQQDCQEVQTSISNMVENVREQVRHLSEEQQQTRDRVRQFEDKEHEVVSMSSALRSQFNSFSKTLNNRSVELEALLHTSVDGLLSSVEELKKEVQLTSEKKDDVVKESRKELERFDIALRGLGDAISEEVDTLRSKTQHHEAILSELRGFHNENKLANEKYVKEHVRLREKVNNVVMTVKQVELSSDERFESVCRALEKSQALTDKLSMVHQRGNEDHISLMTVFQENRDMHKTLAEELRRSLENQSSNNRRELEQLNRRVSDLYQSKVEMIALMSDKNESVMARIEEVYRRIGALESLLPKTNFRMEIDEKVNNCITSELATYEGRLSELHYLIAQQRDKVQGEMECIKTSIGSLEKKYEQTINTARKVENIEERVQTLASQLREREKTLENMHGEMDTLANVVKSSQVIAPALFHSQHKNTNPIEILEAEEVKKFITDAEFGELRTDVECIKNRLNSYDNQLAETEQHVSRCETLVNEIPRTYQRYIEAVDQKLSPALLELDVLRKRVALFELQYADNESRKQLRFLPSSSHEENELEGMRVDIRRNHILQSTQRQLQNIDVRLDNFQTLAYSLERGVEMLSREVSDISETTASLREQERQKDLHMEKELKHIFTRLDELEDEVRVSEKAVATDFTSFQATVTDLKSLEESLGIISGEIKVMEKALTACVTLNSVEWKKLTETVSTMSESVQGDKGRRFYRDYDAYAPLERIVAAEETLSQIRGKQQELKTCLEHIQKLLAEKVDLGFVEQTKNDMERLFSMLQQRVIHLEKNMCVNSSQIPPVVNDALASFGVRVQNLELTVNELKTKKPCEQQKSPRPTSPSSSLSSASLVSANDSPGQVVALDERLKRLESVVAKMRETEEDAAPCVTDPVLMNRMAMLESAMLACSRDVAEYSKVVSSLCQERVDQMRDRLPESDSLPPPPLTSSSSVTVTAGDNTTLTDLLARIEVLESKAEDIQQNLDALKETVHALYTKPQLDGRFENLWASFILLLARKEDQETTEHKLAELRRELTDEVVQMKCAVREVKRDVEGCVSITEVRELLQGMNDK